MYFLRAQAKMCARICEGPGSTLVIKLEQSLLILKGKGTLSSLQLAEIFSVVTSGEQRVCDNIGLSPGQTLPVLQLLKWCGCEPRCHSWFSQILDITRKYDFSITAASAAIWLSNPNSGWEEKLSLANPVCWPSVLLRLPSGVGRHWSRFTSWASVKTES